MVSQGVCNTNVYDEKTNKNVRKKNETLSLSYKEALWHKINNLLGFTEV